MSKEETPKKMYEHLMEKVYEDVQSGRLKAGDKLPSERQLNEQLGISRASVREALRALEAIGIITSQQGEGNFINQDFTEALLKPAAALFFLNGGTKRNAMDMRLHLECLAVRQAALNISPHEIDDLEALLKEMKACENIDERLAIDRNFHRLIAHSTGNVLLVSLSQIVNYITNLLLSIENQRIGVTPELRMGIEIAHHNILVALKEHNPAKAETVMRRHLQEAYRFAMSSEEITTKNE